MSAELKAGLITSVLLLFIIQRSTAKLCDIKDWYKEITDHNYIDTQLSEEQEILIEKIEKKIRNLKYSGTSKTNCDTLGSYQETLCTKYTQNQKLKIQDTKSVDHGDKSATNSGNKKKTEDARKSSDDKSSTQQAKSTQRAGGNNRRKMKKQLTDADDNDSSMKARVTGEDDKSEKRGKTRNTDGATKIHTKDKTSRSKRKNRPQETDRDINEDSQETKKNKAKPTVKTGDKRKEIDADEKGPHDKSTPEAKENEKKLKFETGDETKEIINNPHESLPEQEEDPTESEVDETELMEEEENDDTPTGDATVNEPPPEEGTQTTDAPNIEFQTDQKQSEDTLTAEATVNEPPQEEGAPIEDSPELIDQNQSANSESTNDQTQNTPESTNLEYLTGEQQSTNDDSANDDQTQEESGQSIKHECSVDTQCSTMCYLAFQNQQSLYQYPKLRSDNISKSGTTQNINSDDVNSQDDSNDSTHNRAMHTDDNGSSRYTKEEVETEAKEIPVINPEENQQIPDKVHDPDQTSKSIDDLDDLIHQKASEYSSKITELEILLMKLENKILNQQLHKQNESSSFSKLEFQILKLENELLKLNHSYTKLSEENQVLKMHQIEQDRLHSKANYAALPGANNTKHTELISIQQNKINQLTEWLTNQTNNLNQLRDKSDTLVAQNQLLHQIIMNQTALISNIMQKVQHLSDEHMSHKKETQQIKSKLDLHDSSAEILQKLDSLVNIKAENVPNEEPRITKEKLKRFKFFPEMPDATTNRHNWECKGVLSPQVCYCYSLLLSPCPPYSTIHWQNCPNYIAVKTAAYYTEYLQENRAASLDDSKDTLQTENKAASEKETKPLGDGEDTLQADESKLSGKDSKDAASHSVDEEPSKPEERAKDQKDSTKSNDENNVKKDEKEHAPVNGKDAQNDAPSQAIDDKREEEDDDDEDDNREETRPIRYQVVGLKKPKDCYEFYEKGAVRNGVYKIFLPGLKYYVDAYCDMKNGGWTVIQRRDSGNVDFYKPWDDYKEGFGDAKYEHYLGNDNIHYLTNQGHYSLQVELTNWKKEKRTATYKDFWIDDESNDYMLHIDGFGGDAGDGLTKHNEMKFSTFDVDNDKVVKQFGGSCAKRFHGAGWYYKCYASNLNGQYYENGVVPAKQFDGVAWKPWTGPSYSLKEIVLKIRPKDVFDN